MRTTATTLLAIISLTGIALLTIDLVSVPPTVPRIIGLCLVTLTSLVYAVSLRRSRHDAFRVVLATYADRH